MPDKNTLDWVKVERQRCMALVKKIVHRDFLLYCIDNAYTATDDLKTARMRFDEMQPDVEDLL
jgi:hypothetical protein